MKQRERDTEKIMGGALTHRRKWPRKDRKHSTTQGKGKKHEAKKSGQGIRKERKERSKKERD